MLENLTIVGNISRDTAWYGTSKKGPFLGGAGLNVAWAIAQQGYRPRLISVLSLQDKMLLDKLHQSIDTTSIQLLAGETCQFTLYYSEHGHLHDLISSFGVALALDAYIQQIPLMPAHYHICCRLPLHPEFLLARLWQEELPFSLDFISSSITTQVTFCQEWIASASCVFVNHQEFAVLSRIYDVQRIAMLIVTNAHDPVRVMCHGKEIYQQECARFRVAEVTGAGDVFTGTFLAAHFLQKVSIRQAIAQAVYVARSSLDMLGVCNIQIR
jgi:sugar/nucleoside kinase (ribokinase family)